MSSENKTSSGAWLVSTHPLRKGVLNLICLPFSGGTAQYFAHWDALFGQQVNIIAVQLPGRANRYREPPCTNMAELVAELAVQLKDTIQQPYALFGHSLGSLIAFELALYLQNTGQAMPLHVFASGYSAPCSPWPETRTRPRNMHLLDDAQLVAQLQKLNGTPQEILNDKDLLPIYLPALRADFEILDTWTPGLDCKLNTPITAFGGTDDVASFPKAQIKAWENHTTRQFSFYMLQGDHFFIRSSEPLLRQIMLDKLGLIDDGL